MLRSKCCIFVFFAKDSRKEHDETDQRAHKGKKTCFVSNSKFFSPNALRSFSAVLREERFDPAPFKKGHSAVPTQRVLRRCRRQGTSWYPRLRNCTDPSRESSAKRVTAEGSPRATAPGPRPHASGQARNPTVRRLLRATRRAALRTRRGSDVSRGRPLLPSAVVVSDARGRGDPHDAARRDARRRSPSVRPSRPVRRARPSSAEEDRGRGRRPAARPTDGRAARGRTALRPPPRRSVGRAPAATHLPRSTFDVPSPAERAAARRSVSRARGSLNTGRKGALCP